MMSLTIAGTAVLNSLVKDLSPELAAMLLASVIGGYTLIGGLGATFYVSYFNTALIFVLILMLVVEVKFDLHVLCFNYILNGFYHPKSITLILIGRNKKYREIQTFLLYVNKNEAPFSNKRKYISESKPQTLALCIISQRSGNSECSLQTFIEIRPKYDSEIVF